MGDLSSGAYATHATAQGEQQEKTGESAAGHLQFSYEGVRGELGLRV